MKKILLACFTFSITFAGLSQNAIPEYSLSEIRASDELEHEIYTYNEDLLLESTDILLDNGFLVKDSLRYDASNNIITLDGYQLLNGNWTHVSYIDYTYDGDGNRLTRSNYNSFDGTFNLGGVYNYVYENNKMISWELYMGGTDLFQASTFTYNSNGQLIEELGQDTWNSGSLEDSYKIDYEYNSDGTLKTSAQSFWEGASWNSYGSEWFYYDDNMNCIKWDHKSGNTVTNRNLYDYDLNYTTDQLVLPVNPEDSSLNESLVEMKNMPTVKHWYTENEAGDLMYVCDYIYTYELIDVMGVSNHGFSADSMRIYPNPAADLITITGENAIITNIDIRDATGKMVLQKKNLNKKETSLNVSALQSGVYYIKLLTSKGSHTEKLIVN